MTLYSDFLYRDDHKNHRMMPLDAVINLAHRKDFLNAFQREIVVISD